MKKCVYPIIYITLISAILFCTGCSRKVEETEEDPSEDVAGSYEPTSQYADNYLEQNPDFMNSYYKQSEDFSVPTKPVTIDEEPESDLPRLTADSIGRRAGSDEEIESTEGTSEDDDDDEALLIVIDPGHQEKADLTTEPIGPGSDDMKIKVTNGTRGVLTQTPEYELNLQISFKLRDELELRGYRVIMSRKTNDVNISNSERAQIANDNNADAFIRIHANGVSDPTTSGIMTMCQTKDNPFIPELYEENRRLSEIILDTMVEITGARKVRIDETDELSGINYCKVPSTLIEMGFMTNPEEDMLMATDEYQEKLVWGIADGIDKYFGFEPGE